jgi:hypothetical protein
MLTPDLMERLGNCGGPVPGNQRLPVLVGEPVAFCPASGPAVDEDVELLAAVVTRPGGLNVLDGAALLTTPPRYRAAETAARGWLAEFERRQKGGA